MTGATASDVKSSVDGFISYSRASMENTINNLSNAAASWTSTSWDSIAKPTPGAYTMFTAETDAQIKTALDIFDTALAEITPGSLVAAPNLSGYTAPIWNETFWSNLKSLLTSFTSNITGSDDVDTVVTKLTSETTKLQVALYATDRERRQQTLRDAGSFASSATGAKGFTYPNSMTTALKLAAQQDFMFGCSQSSRDLVKNIFEWAKSNYQFTVEKQISAHSADIDFNMRYAEVLIRVYSEQVRNILQEYRDKIAGEVAKAEQKIKAYSIRLEVIKTNASVSSELDRVNASNFSTEVQQHATDVAKAVETAASNAHNKINAAATMVNAAASMAASASQISIGVINGG